MLSKKIFVLVSLLLVSFLLVGCGTTPLIVDNHAPVITSTAVTEATVGVEYTYNVNANDPDGDALTYSLIRNPSGMEIDEDTGLITWEDPIEGSHGVTVKVSDGVLYVTQSFTVTVMPVAELTEIVVDPDTMALEVEGTGTFQVIAHYSFGLTKDVTHDTDCVYTLPTPNAGVITVTAGSVEADGVGTDTIFISYTEGGITATDNISVTISKVRIPMEIIVDLPTFTAGIPYWFTVGIKANDDVGKLVVASLSGDLEVIGDLEIEEGSGLNFETDEFIVEDATANFRGTFTSEGTYTITIEVKTTDGISLCSKEITILVEAIKVGDIYEGGIVAYILQSDDTGYVEGETHGLIAALTDQSEGIYWHETNGGVTGATATALGTGNANTDLIIALYGEENNAAKLCLDYTNDDTGTGIYSDWFLPSKDELSKLYDNRVAIDGFATDNAYWSSSELSGDFAYRQFFTDDGIPAYSSKSFLHRVRAVRYF